MHFKKVHHAQTAARSHPSCTRGLHAKTMGKDNHAPGQHSTRRMSSAPPGVPTADNSRYEYLLVTLHEGVRTITFNRPDKKNSLNEKMFDEIVVALQEAADDVSTIITTITGSGNVFTAGNDMSNFRTLTMAQTRDVLIRFMGAFVDFPKPLVAVVNGAAVGAGATLLPLFDAVYATDKAVFFTPFSALGITAEGCSTYTFPKVMGPGQTTEMLLFNKKMSAAEACKVGLVTEVFPEATFQQEVHQRLQAMAKLPPKPLVYSKALIRDIHKEDLHKVNVAECQRVTERFAAVYLPGKEEYQEFVMSDCDGKA
ncbi:putative enoyl-CoA delta isomerase 2, mitochondrial isoform X1 [Penaeus vannamei]|uniref:Putative enoyl-CoA delta isomerase 2, mitochondrial isoform X1 n=2 Tax=Penaeus vannamei TaxID=6689 RepID=A0A3R7NFJ2_PENVA|nr:putative enoyl-CoA delta isomerase 2, mitochondrial isoform X1 [Penaeus vannamei]